MRFCYIVLDDNAREPGAGSQWTRQLVHCSIATVRSAFTIMKATKVSGKRTVLRVRFQINYIAVMFAVLPAIQLGVAYVA